MCGTLCDNKPPTSSHAIALYAFRRRSVSRRTMKRCSRRSARGHSRDSVSKADFERWSRRARRCRGSSLPPRYRGRASSSARSRCPARFELPGDQEVHAVRSFTAVPRRACSTTSAALQMNELRIDSFCRRRVSPFDGSRRLVVVPDVTKDFSAEIVDGGKDASGDNLPLDLGEPDFDWLSQEE
jgi:hypothetical protein